MGSWGKLEPESKGAGDLSSALPSPAVTFCHGQRLPRARLAPRGQGQGWPQASTVSSLGWGCGELLVFLWVALASRPRVHAGRLMGRHSSGPTLPGTTAAGCSLPVPCGVVN